MELIDILNQVSAPKGLTSILAGVQSGDFSVIPHQKGVGASIEMADERIATHQKQLDNCQSDWSYWSILGDLEYWKAIKKILEGAAIVGEHNMPNVEYNNKGIVVMDAISELSKFGDHVLSLCKKQSSPIQSETEVSEG